MKDKVFIYILIGITFFGLMLRFWNYSVNFGLGYDQAHDAIVAREAVKERKIPLVGPFSSAGPFQTSGTWYWLLMLPTALYRDSILSPWIFLTVLSACMVFGMGLLGKKLEGNFFGLLLAGMTAVSPAQVAQSFNLTNQTPIPIFAFLTSACAFWYIRKKTMSSAFGMGLFFGLAASIHLQGMALGIPVFIAFLLGGKIKIRAIISTVLAALLPMIPLVLWDMKNDFVNIKNMIYYYRFDQYNVSLDVLGRRWFTYLTEFWPREWAHIIGGFPQVAIFIACIAWSVFMYRIIQKKVSKSWLLVFISFMFMTILLRYTRVPIFASFITFTHVFVILISAWALYQIFKFNKIIGFILILIVLASTMVKTKNEVFVKKTHYLVQMSKEIRKTLMEKYPGEKFAFYDWNYDECNRSVIVALYMDEMNLLSDDGRPIGFTRNWPQNEFETPVVSSFSGIILDLSASTSSQLVEDQWIGINPSFIYTSTEEWRN